MLVYVSGKYSGSPAETDENIAIARTVAAKLWDMGHAVICPHANTGHFEEISHATYEQYIQGDLMMIARCDAMVMLPNWQESKGAKIERDYAHSLGILIWEFPSLPILHPTEVRCPQQSKMFAELLGQMYRTHLRKNADYSPANILATGEVGLITRLWDKIARLLNLRGFKFDISAASFVDPTEPNNESIEDTYMDAAIYSIIGLLLRKGAWGK